MNLNHFPYSLNGPASRGGAHTVTVNVIILILLIAGMASSAHSGWRVIPTGTRQTLRSVYADPWVPGRVAAVGDSGSLVVRPGFGLNFQSRTISPFVDLRSIAMFSAEIGCIAGYHGAILRTIDGGATWDTVQATNADLESISIPFVSSVTGGNIVGSGGTMLSTRDKGKTWQGQTSAGGPDLKSVAMLPTSLLNIVVVGDSGRVLTSTNTGIVWKVVWQSKFSGTLRGVSMSLYGGQSYCIAVGDGGALLRINVSSGTAERIATGTEEQLNACVMLEDGTGYAAGNDGVLLKSVDGGHTWDLLPRVTDANLYGICADAGSHALVCGEHGLLLETTDGGDGAIEVFPSPAQLQFGRIELGTERRTLLMVHNSTAQPVTVDCSVSGDGFTLSEKSIQLQPGDTAGLTLSYSPETAGLDSGKFEASALGRKTIIPLIGSGIGKGTASRIALRTGRVSAGLPRTAFMPSSDIAVAADDQGTIVRSTDAGATWNLAFTDPAGRMFNCLTFCDEHYGWAAGEQGLLARTTDGGTHWALLNPGTVFTFSELQFSDPLRGVAALIAGDGSPTDWYTGSLIRTTDGGATWNILYSSAHTGFSDVSLIGSQGILAVALDLDPRSGNGFGYFVRSDDEGRHWRTVQVGTPGSARECDFLDSLHGFVTATTRTSIVVGGSYVITVESVSGFRTTDGGASWIKQDSPISRIRHSPSGRWFAFGSDGSLLIASGAGEYWASSLSPEPQTEPFVRGSGLYCAAMNGHNGLAFTYSYISQEPATGGTMYRTTNSGSTWQPLLPGFFTERIEDVACASPTTLVACGYPGFLMKSTDNGGHWSELLQQSVYRQRFVGFKGIAAIDSMSMFVVGDWGEILCTSDGGAHWDTRVSGQSALRRIVFADRMHGWAVGSGIISTSDGGATWVYHAPSAGADFNGVNLAGDDAIVAVGASGSIVRLARDGQSWTIQSSGIGTRLNDVWFFNGDTGIIVGDAGVILRTVDGGGRWARLQSPTSVNLLRLRFLDAQRGIAVGSSGEVLFTENGGISWHRLITGLRYSLNGAVFSADGSLIVGGAAGTVASLSAEGGGAFWVLGVSGGSEEELPLAFALGQNYPNPFNPQTSIRFSLVHSGPVTLIVYDVLGREAGRLVDEILSAGDHSVDWNGSGFASGVYFYRLSSSSGTITRKLLLVR